MQRGVAEGPGGVTATSHDRDHCVGAAFVGGGPRRPREGRILRGVQMDEPAENKLSLPAERPAGTLSVRTVLVGFPFCCRDCSQFVARIVASPCSCKCLFLRDLKSG
jgi:hypothetical protein